MWKLYKIQISVSRNKIGKQAGPFVYILFWEVSCYNTEFNSCDKDHKAENIYCLALYSLLTPGLALPLSTKYVWIFENQ